MIFSLSTPLGSQDEIEIEIEIENESGSKTFSR
jgi:hypothetical protein